MNGTLNANASSNNAAWAHIKSLEKSLDALKSDVNADSSLIASVQKELDAYKASIAKELNTSNINVSTLLDVKGTSHLEGDVRCDGNTSLKELSATNITVATSQKNVTTVSSTGVTTGTISATDVNAYSGNFNILEGVDELTTNKANVTNASLDNANINTLKAENAVINSDLNFPKIDSKIAGEYLDIEAENIDADKVTTKELDVGKALTTPSIDTTKVKTDNIEAKGIVTDSLNSSSITTNDIIANGNIKAEGLNINNINVKDLLNSSDSIELTKGAKVLISDEGQIKTAIVREVASSELKLDGYVPYELTKDTASIYGYSIDDIEGTVIKYSKDKIYTTKATYSLLNGTLKKDEDNFTDFNFVTIKGNVGLSYDDTNRKFSWVDLETSSVLGEASLDSTMTYSNGKFYHSDIKTITTKAFYPYMVGKAVVFVDTYIDDYGSFYKNKQLHINDSHWLDIPEINVDEYGVGYDVYLYNSTYSTFTCYTAVTYNGSIYNNSSLKCKEKEWAYAYSNSSKAAVYYTDGTSEFNVEGALIERISGSNVILSNVGTNIGSKDINNDTITNYTVDSLDSTSIIKNAEYAWWKGTPTELGTTISTKWFNSSRWSNEVWVNNGNFETYIPFKAKDVEAENIVASNITADSMNISSGVTLENANIISLTSDSIKAKSIETDELKLNSSLSFDDASIDKLTVGSIKFDGENSSSIKKGGYVSILGNATPIDSVEANSLDISTSEFIESPAIDDTSTIVSDEYYDTVWGNWVRKDYKYFYVNKGELEFKFEVPSTVDLLNIQYTYSGAYVVYANTKGVYSYSLDASGYFSKQEVSYPEEMGEIQRTSNLIYAQDGSSYTYINNKWFETTSVASSIKANIVMVLNNFLLFTSPSYSTQYFHATYTQVIENIAKLEEAPGRPILLSGWKFSLEGETYQPEAVSSTWKDDAYVYTMFDNNTVSTKNASTPISSVGLIGGSVYNLAYSASKAFASTVFDNNSMGRFVNADSNKVLTTIEDDIYPYTSVPASYNGSPSFTYRDSSGKLYSQYKKTTLVNINENGIVTNSLVFKGTNGSVKRKYVYGNFWNEMKDLTIVDVKGFNLSSGEVVDRITGLYNKTASTIILTKQALGSDTIDKIAIDSMSTSTPEAGEGYRLVVDYYEV